MTKTGSIVDDITQIYWPPRTRYISPMNIEFGFDWLLFILFIAGLIYTMKIIKSEKDVVLKNGKSFKLGEIEILTPPWWSATTNTEDKLIFERTDTRYDWRGTFEKLALPSETFDLQQYFVSLIQTKKLELDEIHAFTPAESLHEDHRVLHIESTATQNGIERIYYDAYLILSSDQANLYYFESLSSVLNGMVEGPYFEGAAKTFKRI